MLYIMSEQDVADHTKKLDEWFLGLDWATKNSLHALFEPLLKQAKCTHSNRHPFENGDLCCQDCSLVVKPLSCKEPL